MKLWVPIVALAGVAGAATLAALQQAPYPRVVAEYATTLDGRAGSQRHNAELAFDRLNGATVGPGQTFSFNTRVGTFSRDEGYVKAPVSYNGQLINDWGGGVCQASTTLYNAALLAGMKIEERHRHRHCPSYVPPGLDAAVAYSNIDLRFKNPYPFAVRIKAVTMRNALRVTFLAPSRLPRKPKISSRVRNVQMPSTFALGDPAGQARLRNSGKSGYEVAVFRTIGNQRELVSRDTYPVMNRVIQYDAQ